MATPPAAKRVIAVDGAAHDMGDRPQRDVERTAYLERGGFQVVRIAASDVLRDPDEVADSVVSMILNPLHHGAARRGPPPRERGGSLP